MQEFKEVSRLKGDIGIELEPSETNIYAWKAFLRVRCCTLDSVLESAICQLAPGQQHSTRRLFTVASGVQVFLRNL